MDDFQDFRDGKAVSDLASASAQSNQIKDWTLGGLADKFGYGSYKSYMPSDILAKKIDPSKPVAPQVKQALGNYAGVAWPYLAPHMDKLEQLRQQQAPPAQVAQGQWPSGPREFKYDPAAEAQFKQNMGLAPSQPGQIPGSPQILSGFTPGASGAPLGGSAYLQQQRAPFAKDLQSPQVKAMAILEGAKDPVPVIESLANRAAYTGQPISQLLNSGFYGPINRGQLPGAMRQLASNPGLSARMDDAVKQVVAGSNELKGYTDQGLPTDPNGRHFPQMPRGGNIFNDWGGGPGGHAGAAAFRAAQQKAVEGGGNSMLNATPADYLSGGDLGDTGPEKTATYNPSPNASVPQGFYPNRQFGSGGFDMQGNSMGSYGPQSITPQQMTAPPTPVPPPQMQVSAPSNNPMPQMPGATSVPGTPADTGAQSPGQNPLSQGLGSIAKLLSQPQQAPLPAPPQMPMIQAFRPNPQMTMANLNAAIQMLQKIAPQLKSPI